MVNPLRVFKVGDRVNCPPDRGQPGYTGTVEYVDTTENKAFSGSPYNWVNVRRDDTKTAHVWPSSRLSKI